MRAEIEKAVRLLQQEDEKSLEQALSLLQNTVFSFSMRVCGQREDAEDTMQEVLARSVPYLPKFESARALVVWLYKVARSRCLMSRRRSKFAPPRELSLEELMPVRGEIEQLRSETINPEAFAIRSEEAGLVRKAIQKLPPQYRIVLVLRDMEGLTDDEVAEIVGLRPGTVRVRLHRARLFVRRELTKSLSASRSTVPAKKDRPPSRPARCRAMFAELSNYLDEKLDESMCEELEKHMDGCEPCQAFVKTLEATIETLHRHPGATPSAAQTARLRKELMLQYERAIAGAAR